MLWRYKWYNISNNNWWTCLISYNWSTGDTNSTANNLYAGSFAVTITDTAGCSLNDSTILIEPIELTST